MRTTRSRSFRQSAARDWWPISEIFQCIWSTPLRWLVVSALLLLQDRLLKYLHFKNVSQTLEIAIVTNSKYPHLYATFNRLHWHVLFYKWNTLKCDHYFDNSNLDKTVTINQHQLSIATPFMWYNLQHNLYIFIDLVTVWNNLSVVVYFI